MQPSASFHVTPRGYAGPNAPAMNPFEKFASTSPSIASPKRYVRQAIEPCRAAR
jgi:transposase